VVLGERESMMKDINAAVTEVYNLPDFMIFMHEYSLELVAHNGNLHSDNRKRVEEQKKVYGA
jgi:hypothetical protein